MATFILEKLTIGNEEDLKNPPQEITAILDVADDTNLPCPPLIKGDEGGFLRETNKKYHKIPLQDGKPIPLEKMKEAIGWIGKNIVSEKLMVCCKYGVGRSASVIIGYLCSIGFKYEKAVEFVASKKLKINPLPQLADTIRMALNRS